MKAAPVLLGVMLLILTGCSSVKQVEVSQKEAWMQGAQQDLLGREATVTTSDGRGAAGSIFILNSDSLCLQNDGTNSIMSFELDRVTSIRQPANAWPAVAGFAGGLLVGAIIGGAIGTEGAVHADNVDSGVETFVWSPVIGGVIGGVAGAVILGSVTSRTSYEILHASPRKSPDRTTSTSPDSTKKRN